MQITQIASALRPNEVETGALSTKKPDGKSNKPEDIQHASQQFEAILLRQFLTESMGPMLQGGPSGQVFGYMVTDSLASSISEGGGLGLAHILQSQLGGKAQPQ